MNFYKTDKKEEKEFIDLYNKWQSSFMFSAFGSADPRARVFYEALIDWCKKHHDEALEYIKEILTDEPNQVVKILDDLYSKEFNFTFEGYCPLDLWCNIWLNILNNDIDLTKSKPKKNQIKDYYKDYNKYKKYMKEHYMSWRPNLEDDPNVTQEEFKQGKRNNKNMKRKWHEFPLSILKDEELEKLYNEGHLGDMTKYIAELHFFYNQVEEEIKRRKLNKTK